MNGIRQVLVYVADKYGSNPFGDNPPELEATITPPELRLPVDEFTISALSEDEAMAQARSVSAARAKKPVDPSLVLASITTDGGVVVTLPHDCG